MTFSYDKIKKAKPSLVPFCFLLETHTVYKLIFEILFDLFKFAIFDLKFDLVLNLDIHFTILLTLIQ